MTKNSVDLIGYRTSTIVTFLTLVYFGKVAVLSFRIQPTSASSAMVTIANLPTDYLPMNPTNTIVNARNSTPVNINLGTDGSLSFRDFTSGQDIIGELVYIMA